jgi:copper chaperone CopZ
VKEALSAVDGVGTVEPDLSTKEATVAYDPGKTTPQKLAQVLTDYEGAHDFTATVKQ